MTKTVARKDGEASRRRILAAVRDNPGLHVSELESHTGLSWHTVAYHLKILVGLRAVVIDKTRRERRVFPAGLTPAERSRIAVLRGEHAAAVLAVLASDAGLSVTALAHRLALSEKVVRRQVAHLVDAGLLQRQGVLHPVYSLARGTHGVAAQSLPAPSSDGPAGIGGKRA